MRQKEKHSIEKRVKQLESEGFIRDSYIDEIKSIVFYHPKQNIFKTVSTHTF